MTSTKHLASTVHMLFPNSPHPSSVQLNCSAHSPRTACIQNCSDLTYTTHMQQPHPPSRTFTLLQAGSKQLQRCAYAAHCGTGLFCPRQLLHSSCTSSKAACSSHAAKRWPCASAGSFHAVPCSPHATPAQLPHSSHPAPTLLLLPSPTHAPLWSCAFSKQLSHSSSASLHATPLMLHSIPSLLPHSSHTAPTPLQAVPRHPLRPLMQSSSAYPKP